jgi:hypothetical protein
MPCQTGEILFDLRECFERNVGVVLGIFRTALTVLTA